MLHHFEAAEDVAFGVGERLALLGGQRLRAARVFSVVPRGSERKLRRITAVWDYLRAAADTNRAFLMGGDADMAWVDIGSI